MSFVDLDLSAARAGRIDCVCGISPSGVGQGPLAIPGTAAASQPSPWLDTWSETWRLSLGFGFAVLAQALMLAAFPVAGAAIAPGPLLANLPYALTLLGAALASIPASLLLDQFGRRAAFALGASLGSAGGLLAGWAIATRHFPGLCIGALWLGMAQGFSLFYRHAAATGHRGGSRAALSVFAGGCAASLFVPATIALTQQAFTPFADAALMLAAGVASFAALPLVLGLPQRFAGRAAAEAPHGLDRSFWLASMLGALSWFAMAFAMAHAPTALIGCGVGMTVMGGLVSWHLLAMYGPMLLTSRLTHSLPTWLIGGTGIAFLSLNFMLPHGDAVAVELLLVLAGLGWSLVQIGASRLLYDKGDRPKLAFALHDGVILGAALLGALSAALA